jgi:hypothetical protein
MAGLAKLPRDSRSDFVAVPLLAVW